MKTFLGPDYVPMVVTTEDLIIAAIALGFTIGFGFLTTCMLTFNIIRTTTKSIIQGMR